MEASTAQRQPAQASSAHPLRAQARLDALRAGGDRDAAGHRLSDRLRDRPLAAEARPALPRRGRLRRPRQLRHGAQLANCGGPTSSTPSSSWSSRSRSSWCSGWSIALVMYRAIFGRGVVRTVGPDPLRDHHRGRRLRLVLRLRPGQRLRQPPAVRRRRQGLVRRPLQRASR